MELNGKIVRSPDGAWYREYFLQDGQPHPLALILPGGGYRIVADWIEGEPYAEELNRHGCHAAVLYYHVNEDGCFPKPMDDVAWAIRSLMACAEEKNLDLRGYSVWGASAGAHLAASFGMESLGWKHYGLPRPGAVVLCYPVVTMLGEVTHISSRNFLLGHAATRQQMEATSMERLITPEYPPAYLWWGSADTCVDPENSRMLWKALENNRVPVEGGEIPGVEHGVGLGRGLACDGWINRARAFWLSRR